jgi:hypothetical protein
MCHRGVGELFLSHRPILINAVQGATILGVQVT